MNPTKNTEIRIPKTSNRISRVICIIGFWISSIYVFFVVIFPWGSAPNQWPPVINHISWLTGAAYVICEVPQVQWIAAAISAAIAAYGFHAGRSKGRPWLYLSVYVALRILIGIVHFSAAAYLVSLEEVVVTDAPWLRGATFTRVFLPGHTYGHACLGELVMNLPIVFVFVLGVSELLQPTQHASTTS